MYVLYGWPLWLFEGKNLIRPNQANLDFAFWTRLVVRDLESSKDTSAQSTSGLSLFHDSKLLFVLLICTSRASCYGQVSVPLISMVVLFSGILLVSTDMFMQWLI